MEKKKRKHHKISSARDLCDLVVKAAEEKLARDIKVIDVSRTSDITDYFVICGGDSAPQLKAISDSIEVMTKQNAKRKPRWEGSVNSNWLILDLGDVIVHIMGEAERDRYKLDELWERSAIIYHE